MTLDLTFNLGVKVIWHSWAISRLIWPLELRCTQGPNTKGGMPNSLMTLDSTFNLGIKVIWQKWAISRLIWPSELRYAQGPNMKGGMPNLVTLDLKVIWHNWAISRLIWPLQLRCTQRPNTKVGYARFPHDLGFDLQPWDQRHSAKMGYISLNMTFTA